MKPRWRALLVLAGARTSMGFQFQSLGSVSPSLMADLGLGFGDLGTLIGLYFLPGILVALPGGALGRRFGDLRLVAIGLALMAGGGFAAAMAPDVAVLSAGRLVSGIGGVLLNVLMAKMVTDWFAGQDDLMLAMAVFVNSFAIGVGLALLILTPLAAAWGWAVGLAVAAGFAVAALIFLLLAYARHPKDGAGGAGGMTGLAQLSRMEVVLVSLAGAMWGILNGAFGVTFGFAPSFLVGAGVSTVATGLIVGVSTWLVVVSVQAGGMLAQRGVSPALLMLLGAGAWAACLLVFVSVPGLSSLSLLGAGLLMGLPVGIIMSLPARALRPENRAVGMGLFYTWLYIGHGGMPPLAGWLQDVSGHAAAPLLLSAAAVLMLPVLLGLFQRTLAAEGGRGTPARSP